MELQTISQVSKQFKISTRTLRYYEQIGLIQSTMKEDYSFRAYDEGTILRLKQIIVLRKLRIPLKSIAEILLTENTALAIEVFQQNLNEIGDEITALTTIKSITQSFIERLNIKNAKLKLLDDENLLEIVDSLTTSKINFKEDKTMDDLIKADEKLNKLTDKDVRIVYLPPATVASIHIIGGRDPNGKNSELSFYPEDKTSKLLNEFIKTVNLSVVKPDFRHFGFNHPDGSNQGGPADDHGYERWVTIPENMDVPKPFEKKKFKGGLYAAHMIPMGAFEEWGWLVEWVQNNGKYTFGGSGDPECMFGSMEEHLNYINLYMVDDWSKTDKVLQLDLLIPIREK